ncbi:Eco57I restriction-modification methylase domain-containing protein [Bacillus toyonensis]|uniref:Eco57I restriction-modification methylase domain-containing protein n=1 Tax=Bacillus toyonensis TaxID=155322 RepID=UPI0015969175|nr:DNA methyltransferase [Bacillus toyonensis]
MKYPVNEIRNNINSFDFKRLFIEDLGWNNCNLRDIKVEVNEGVFWLHPIAEIAGMPALTIVDENNIAISNFSVRKKIERELSKSYREHIIIYIDAAKTRQIWQWVRRVKDEPLSIKEYNFYEGQTGEAIIQKLRSIYFGFEDFEHGNVNIMEVATRASSAFDLEKVTKKFFDQFNKERKQFIKYIDGIDDKHLREWYVSVILNRLMFTYFIQKKGFLNSDVNYLRNNLNRIGEKYTSGDRFFSEFLSVLFFKGFALVPGKRSSHTVDVIGEIPYLNGGLFVRHHIEEVYPDIVIQDEAFEKIFDFFEKYNWHLDDRPNKKDNEINPDVLGYLFEKYINQKQMGAYYTKEDITNYISKNSIIPYLFGNLLKNKDKKVNVSRLLQDILSRDPDRYIYGSTKKGIESQDDFNLLNVMVNGDIGLPTETWNDFNLRIANYREIFKKMKNGEVFEIEDLVTSNLDVRQIMQDFIEECEDPDIIVELYKEVREIKVLDPTCGSGAFLFEALNILEAIYHSLIIRMTAWLNEPNILAHHYEKVNKELSKIQRHNNQDYFILKTIMINNLYGVDIMEEAVEICKLRLFLKLISQINSIEELEPLPDIDFNIRSGNTLVGFESIERAREIVESTLDYDGFTTTLNVKIDLIKNLFAKYKDEQIDNGSTTYNIKQELNTELFSLKRELNRYLKNVHAEQADYTEWVEKNLPFHWFVDFYGIMEQGGFDVLIGNPPYVEYGKIKSEYELYDYKTIKTNNLYAYVLERCNYLLKENGMMGMIIPHSAFCTDRMAPLMELYKDDKMLWISTYSIRPSKLFVGVDQRLAIMLYQPCENTNKVFTTKYHHWMEPYRPFLFENLMYVEHNQGIAYKNSIPKLSNKIEADIWYKINAKKPLANDLGIKSDVSTIYYHNAPRYWLRAMNFIPYFWNEKEGHKISSHVKPLYVKSIEDGDVVSAAINSSLFFWWFILLSNCRDLSTREIKNFPLGLSTMSEEMRSRFVDLNHDLMEDYQKNAQRKEANYATGKVVYDEFYPRYSKHIIDRVDTMLAEYYGLTELELQYIINFEIKVRLGADDD